ncbi:MAG: hypothetical protein ACI85O_002279, partial [Saprospiraceae bacterium]
MESSQNQVFENENKVFCRIAFKTISLCYLCIVLIFNTMQETLLYGIKHQPILIKYISYMRKFFSLFICLLFLTSAQAQDPFFSQFYAAPMTLNPALTGSFNGKFRVSTIYRDQYRKTLERPFSTYAVSTDLRFTPGKFKSAYKDNIG